MRSLPRRPRSNGKDVPESPPAARIEVQDEELQPLPAVRPPARVPAQVRPLPHLPARDRPRGHDPRPHEVELVARILSEQGYIEDFSVEPARVGRVLRVRLKYTEARKPVIQGLERLSKPGRRQYVSADAVPKVQGGMGTSILSTSRGVMTGHEARRAGVGGELVARVW